MTEYIPTKEDRELALRFALQALGGLVAPTLEHVLEMAEAFLGYMIEGKKDAAGPAS